MSSQEVVIEFSDGNKKRVPKEEVPVWKRLVPGIKIMKPTPVWDLSSFFACDHSLAEILQEASQGA